VIGNQKTGSSFFIQKHSFVKAQVSKRGTAKQLGEISGIILNNMKGQQTGDRLQIRQIKDLGSNPGSRVGS